MENQKTRSVGQKPLSLMDLSSAFVIYGLGICLAALNFIIELIVYRIVRRCRNQVLLDAPPAPPAPPTGRSVQLPPKRENLLLKKPVTFQSSSLSLVDVHSAPINYAIK